MPFCFGRNLQFHIGLWDESVRLHALSMVYLLFLSTALSPVFSSKSTKGHYAWVWNSTLAPDFWTWKLRLHTLMNVYHDFVVL
jgi:hypothetical protein